MAWAVLAIPSQVTAFERLGAITLDSGETDPVPSVIDPTGAFAYFGTATKPGRVVKIDLGTFERVDAITLESGEDQLESAVIDPAGAFAYFSLRRLGGGVVPPGSDRGLRRCAAQVLPGRSQHPRPDGGVSQQDIRAHPLWTVTPAARADRRVP